MNIFIIEDSLRKCAESMCDKHVCKMTLEYCQLLCSVYHQRSFIHKDNIPYRLTHPNHPCAVWARHSSENFNVLLELTTYTIEEYTARYLKTHKSQRVLEWAKDAACKINFDNDGLTEFPSCVPEHYKLKATSVIDRYRYYYANDKKFAKWAKLPDKKPNWLQQYTLC